MNLAQKPSPQAGPRRDSSRFGFTLVEVMVATVLLAMIILGILTVMIGSYRVAAKARYNDHARYVIKSFADQFLTQQTVDATGTILPLFTVSNATGYGLSWTNSDGSVAAGGTDPGSSNIIVLLGDNTGAPIHAKVTRTVWSLYASGANAGTPAMTPQNGSAGYLLRGDFTVSYTFPPNSPQGALLSQTVTAIRSVP